MAVVQASTYLLLFDNVLGGVLSGFLQTTTRDQTYHKAIAGRLLAASSVLHTLESIASQRYTYVVQTPY